VRIPDRGAARSRQSRKNRIAATHGADLLRPSGPLRRIFPQAPTRGKVHRVLRGTNFQIKVWEVLIRTEPGRVIAYRQPALQLCRPKTSRPVGSAVAANTIGFVIPCRPVIREGGDVGPYHWGSERKPEGGRGRQAGKRPATSPGACRVSPWRGLM
jgi:O-6-methylguanine DNA methyltransferase